MERYIGNTQVKLQWSGRSVCFADTKKRSRGLTKVLKRHLFPSCTYKSLKDRPKNVGGRNVRSACRAGKALDRVVSKWAESKRIPDARSSTTGRALIQWCVQHKFMPVCSQLLVGDSKLRLATHIDLVLWHKPSSTLYLTEVKLGCVYRDCTTKTTKRCDFVVTKSGTALQTFRGMHEMQILIGRHLFHETYARSQQAECLLLYVIEDTTNTTVAIESSFSGGDGQGQHGAKFGCIMSELTLARLRCTKEVLNCRKRKKTTRKKTSKKQKQKQKRK